MAAQVWKMSSPKARVRHLANAGAIRPACGTSGYIFVLAPAEVAPCQRCENGERAPERIRNPKVEG